MKRKITDEWTQVDALAGAMDDCFKEPPDAVLVLGSGLGSVADRLGDKLSVPVAELPHYPQSTVVGHAGMLHQGRVGDRTVLIQQGRVHLYEGYSPAEVVRPLRAAVRRGASLAVLTNAAGGLDPSFSPGDLMLIEDHLNLTGTSPLLGPNDDSRGPRFPDMSEAYDPALRTQLKGCAATLGVSLHSGVYAGLPGPTYETPAEVRMLQLLGASAVGMSTVQEVIAVRHMGAAAAAISCITNPAAGLSKTALNHEEVSEAGARAAADLARLLIAFLEESS